MCIAVQRNLNVQTLNTNSKNWEHKSLAKDHHVEVYQVHVRKNT